MKDVFSYSTEFTLDKEHFIECYTESVVSDHSIRAYVKSIFLAVFGAVLVLFTHINAYAAWFVFSLGILEAVSVYYQKPWWVTRQMLSKAANGEVKLTINEQGINTASFYLNNTLLWDAITDIKPTTAGWLIVHSTGRHYLSNRCLSAQAKSYLSEKASLLS